MPVSGERFENPAIGMSFVFQKTAAETQGELMRVEITVSPHGGVKTFHFHPFQEERFEVLEGEITFWIDGKEEVGGIGRKIVLPPNTPHDWWNGSDKVAKLIVEFSPALHWDELFEITAKLAREGKIKAGQGSPNLLQTAVMFGGRYKGHAFLTAMPVGVQKGLFAVLAPIGRLLGYKEMP